MVTEQPAKGFWARIRPERGNRRKTTVYFTAGLTTLAIGIATIIYVQSLYLPEAADRTGPYLTIAGIHLVSAILVMMGMLCLPRRPDGKAQ